MNSKQKKENGKIQFSRSLFFVWNFKELMHHIAYGIGWWKENYIKKTETAWEPPAAEGTKEEIITLLDEAYQALKNTISDTELNESKIRGFYATLDHITHHRGQAVLYLRFNEITPP